ncbi:MAG: ribbon-helix-helix protein, CopG family [Gammaproteobacteria bacterium]
MAAKERIGPRGGKTTRTKTGAVRKTLWLGPQEAAALARLAAKERRAETEIVREALRRHLGIED